MKQLGWIIAAIVALLGVAYLATRRLVASSPAAAAASAPPVTVVPQPSSSSAQNLTAIAGLVTALGGVAAGFLGGKA